MKITRKGVNAHKGHYLPSSYHKVAEVEVGGNQKTDGSYETVRAAAFKSSTPGCSPAYFGRIDAGCIVEITRGEFHELAKQI